MIGEEWFINTYIKSNFFNILSSIIGNKHLDVGCGEGHLTYFIAKNFPKTLVVGIDTKAKVTHKTQNLSVRRVFINKPWPFKEDFDSSTICFVLHETFCVDSMLAQVNKALKYDSKAIIVDYKKVSKRIFKKFFKCRKERFQDEYIEHNKFGLKEYKEMFSRHNFRIISIKRINPIIICMVIEKIIK